MQRSASLKLSLEIHRLFLIELKSGDGSLISLAPFL